MTGIFYHGIIAIFIAIILSACATLFNGETSSFAPKQFSIICDDKRYLLSLSDEPNFALFDASLAPVVARKIENGKFVNSKFLPPSARFDELFAEILHMVNDGKNELEFQNCKVRELR